MAGFLLRRSLRLLALLCGVSAILFLLLDSGLLGEPTGSGPRPPSLEDLGRAKLASGQWQQFESRMVQVQLQGPAMRFFLQAKPESLELTDLEGKLVAAWSTQSHTVKSLAVAMDGTRIGDSWQLQAWLADPDHPLAQAPAQGFAVALGAQKLFLDAPYREAVLPWAQARAPWLRFGRQLGKLLRFEFGRSLQDDHAIAPEMARRSLRSLALSLPAFLLSTLLALALAGMSLALAARWDRLMTAIAVAGMSITALAYVLFLQRWFAADLGWFPVYGWSPPYLSYLILPVLIWVVVGVWWDFRFYRGVLLEQSRQAFVTAARAKGISRSQLFRRHLLPNTWLPFITQSMLSLPYLFTGSFLLESYFGIPGLGRYAVDAALDGDAPILRATAFLFALVFLLSQWTADALYRLADPRLRRPR
ncbi:MAG: ABC transporter permease [Planctomycetota bacterium]|nr:MAG: ABC transporter permease [Planctomycetota bacterium]